MIGIITYISVLERTKEIGILRSIGASKRDVSRIFTAETFIIGFVSGVLGIVVTVLLDIPVNMIIEQVAGVANLAAVPVAAGVGLVLISVVLSLVAGVAPSRMAAKKDPVTALRTE
nr:FtsX-like permease family protein [Collinsella tanakaei]